MSVTWNPTNQEDIEAKKAFDNLSHSADKVVLASADPAQPGRFVLRSKGYFDVQAYILSGIDFPSSSSSFENKIPKSTFKKLSELDGGIYDITRDMMVAVGSTCVEYHRNHLAKLITAGRAAIQFSDNTVELLETADDINLRYRLSILMDEKYTSPDRFDDAYRDSKEASQMVLQMLRDDAREKQNQTDQVTQTLIRLREETVKNKPNVEFLTKQYRTGPVQNGSGNKTPYLEYLNKDLADSLVNFNKMVKATQDQDAGWETNTTIPVGTCWFGPAGWNVMGTHAANAKGVRDACDTLESQIASLHHHRKEETDLINLVNLLILLYTDIDRKMADAITAITELSLFFRNQFECYDKIAVSLDRMRPSSDVQTLRSRKQFVQNQLKVSVNKLKDLKVAAEDFTRAITAQIMF